jgi:hypothetical protein
MASLGWKWLNESRGEHLRLHLLNVLLACIILYQYSETNVMHFLFNLLRIRVSTCFAHYLLILRRRYKNATWRMACVLCQLAVPGLEFHSNPGTATVNRTLCMIVLSCIVLYCTVLYCIATQL